MNQVQPPPMLAAHRIRSIPFTSFCISRAAGESSPTLSNAPLESPGGDTQTPAGTVASSRIDSGTPASGVPFTFPWPPAQLRKQRKRGRELLQIVPRPGGLERGSFPRRGFNDYNIAKEPLLGAIDQVRPTPPSAPPRPAQPSHHTCTHAHTHLHATICTHPTPAPPARLPTYSSARLSVCLTPCLLAPLSLSLPLTLRLPCPNLTCFALLTGTAAATVTATPLPLCVLPASNSRSTFNLLASLSVSVCAV